MSAPPRKAEKPSAKSDATGEGEPDELDMGWSGKSLFPPPESSAPAPPAKAPPSLPAPTLTLLLVGHGFDQAEALLQALEHDELYVETATEDVHSAVLTVAPDAVVLVGDAAADAGQEMTRRLARSVLTADVPVFLVASDDSLASRIRALKNGVAGVVRASVEVSDLADQLTRLARSISNRDGTFLADFANVVAMLESEVQVDRAATTATSTRARHLQPVLGAERPLAEVVEAIKNLDRAGAPAPEAPSETSKPETSDKSDEQKPEMDKRPANEPDVQQPKLDQPEVTKPAVEKPEIEKAKPPEAEVAKPEVETAKPPTAQPGPRKPFGSRPDAPKPLPFKAEPAKPQPFKAHSFLATPLKQPELAKSEAGKAETSKGDALKSTPIRTSQPSRPEIFRPQPFKPHGAKPDAPKLVPAAPYVGRPTLPGPIPNLRAPLRSPSHVAKSPLTEKPAAESDGGKMQPKVIDQAEAAALDTTPAEPTAKTADAKAAEQHDVPAGSNASALQGESDSRRTEQDLHADSPPEAPFVAAVTAPVERAASEEIRKFATPLPTPAPVSDLPARRSPIPQNVVRWWRDQPQRRRRAAGGLAVLSLLIVALGIAFAEKGDQAQIVRSFPTRTPPPPPKQASVVERARAGDAQAVATLEALSPERRSVEESHALARGRLALKHDEMETFLNTLRANPSVLESKDSMARLRGYLENPALSLDMLRALAELPGSRGADVLYDVWAKRKKPDDTSLLAEALLSSENVRSKASPALRIALDAARLKECTDVKNWLPVAKEYGDRRAVQPLAQLAKRRGCGPDGRKDCFPCLRKDTSLVVAIRAVAKRAPPKF